MSSKVLLDTNVMLDLALARPEGFDAAAAIAEAAGPRALHFDTVQQALPALREQLTPGTAMLVKASHAMEFGKIVNELETTTYDRHQCDRSGQIL